MSLAHRVGRAARLAAILVLVGGVGYGLWHGDPGAAFPVVFPAAVVLSLLQLPGARAVGGSSYDSSGSGSPSSSLWSGGGSDAGSGGGGGDSGGSSGGDSSGGGGSW